VKLLTAPPKLKRYAKVGNTLIRPLKLRGEHSAYDQARAFYLQFPDLNFQRDLVDYMRNGFVIVRPNLFGMFRPIEYDGRRGWFIRISIGSLLELVTCFPCKLDFIAFCRNNDDNMRVIQFDEFLRTVRRVIGCGNNGAD
jgi:hypothetical protein